MCKYVCRDLHLQIDVLDICDDAHIAYVLVTSILEMATANEPRRFVMCLIQVNELP
jgi:hypothetical protein